MLTCAVCSLDALRGKKEELEGPPGILNVFWRTSVKWMKRIFKHRHLTFNSHRILDNRARRCVVAGKCRVTWGHRPRTRERQQKRQPYLPHVLNRTSVNSIHRDLFKHLVFQYLQGLLHLDEDLLIMVGLVFVHTWKEAQTPDETRDETTCVWVLIHTASWLWHKRLLAFVGHIRIYSPSAIQVLCFSKQEFMLSQKTKKKKRKSQIKSDLLLFPFACFDCRWFVII